MLLKDIDSKQLKTSIVCCKDLINKIENDKEKWNYYII